MQPSPLPSLVHPQPSAGRPPRGPTGAALSRSAPTEAAVTPPPEVSTDVRPAVRRGPVVEHDPRDAAGDPDLLDVSGLSDGEWASRRRRLWVCQALAAAVLEPQPLLPPTAGGDGALGKLAGGAGRDFDAAAVASLVRPGAGLKRSEPGRPLRMTAIDGGGLTQVGCVLEALVAAGHRDIHLSLADRHYPSGLCGSYTFDTAARRWRRDPSPLCEGPSPPVVGAQEAARALSSREALPHFLMHAGAWAAAGGSLALMVCRDTLVLTDAMARRAVPPADLVVAPELRHGEPISPSWASRALGLDALGSFEVIFEQGRRPALFREVPRHCPPPDEVLGKLVGWNFAGRHELIERLGGRKLAWFDAPEARLRGVCRYAAPHAQLLYFRDSGDVTACAASTWAHSSCTEPILPDCRMVNRASDGRESSPLVRAAEGHI